MKKTRIILLSSIVIICTIIIGIVIYFQMTENDYNKAIEKTNNLSDLEDEIELLKNSFDNIFDNSVTGNIENIEKVKEESEIVYTFSQKTEVIPNKYDLDVQIPQINIKGQEVEKCNNEIKKIFQDKAANIMSKDDMYTVYSVKYHTYINDNVISLIIKSKLKEGTNSERQIIKTYNYDISEEKFISLEEIITRKNIEKTEVQEKINNEIASKIDYEKNLLKLGYQTYTRNIDDEMYKVENCKNYIIGQQGRIYIIYAYGNNNYTSEIDLIII